MEKSEKNENDYGEELLIDDITLNESHEKSENHEKYMEIMNENELKKLRNKAESLLISRNLLGDFKISYICIYELVSIFLFVYEYSYM